MNLLRAGRSSEWNCVDIDIDIISVYLFDQDILQDEASHTWNSNPIVGSLLRSSSLYNFFPIEFRASMLSFERVQT